MDFKEQYKHPQWQKKRLEALEDAEYVCQRCFDSGRQLHVHHRQYFKGRMVWEYKTSELEVICDSCHSEAHADLDYLKEVLSVLPTECLPEIASLIKGFASVAAGPIRVSGIKDDGQYKCPDAFVAGQIAGAANNACSIYEMLSLRDQLERLFHSFGHVELAVSGLKSAFDKFMSQG